MWVHLFVKGGGGGGGGGRGGGGGGGEGDINMTRKTYGIGLAAFY